MTLAVLPFANLTGDAAQEYFSDGLTEEMIAHLGRLDPQHLGVIARTSVMPYKNTQKHVETIVRVSLAWNTCWKAAFVANPGR